MTGTSRMIGTLERHWHVAIDVAIGFAIAALVLEVPYFYEIYAAKGSLLPHNFFDDVVFPALFWGPGVLSVCSLVLGYVGNAFAKKAGAERKLVVIALTLAYVGLVAWFFGLI